MKILGIIVVLTIALVFFFWPGYPPNQFLQKLISGNSQQSQIQQPSKSKLASHEIPKLLNIEIQSEVSKDDEKAIREGIRITDFYLNEWFGKSINKEAGLRVNAIASPSMGEDAKVEMAGDKMLISISTNSTIWRQMLDINKQYGGEWRDSVSAHEYVHVYQFQNGCGNVASQKKLAPKWFMEGEAVLLSFKSLMDSDNLPSFFGLDQMFSVQVKQTGNLKPLSSYTEEADVNIGQYMYFALAVSQLIKNKDLKSLDNFCSNLSQGQARPVAFQNAFGISLDKFYSDFESYRQKLK